MLKILVVTAVHNEDPYLENSMKSSIIACRRANLEWRIKVILDRCTDKSESIARQFRERNPNIEIFSKRSSKWNHSYAENLQIGLNDALKLKTDLLAVVDADIVLDKNYFLELLPSIGNSIMASASGILITNPLHKTTFSRIYQVWEKTYHFGLNVSAWGASRIYDMQKLIRFGGFRDFASPDTELDIRLKEHGYTSGTVEKAVAYHIRDMYLQNIINSQIKLGMSRSELNLPLFRTFVHAFLRVRPGLIAGHLIGLLEG